MKNIFRFNTIRVAALVVMSVIPFSCEDILKEDPGTFLSQAKTFSNSDGAKAATMGIYQSLRGSGYYGTSFLRNLTHHADYCLGRGSQAPMANFQIDATNITRISEGWVAIYGQIYRANLVIKEVPNVPGIDAGLASTFVAEAKFLRALGYYNLVRAWGAVPLRLEPETSNFSIGRASVDEIYSQVIADLQAVEEVLPSTWPTADLGRATKWAAKTLLADVFLTRERWTDAAAKAKEVMDSNLFSLVRIATSNDFQTKMFGPDILTHSEDIFSIKYNVAQNNDPYVRHFHKPEANYAQGGSFGVLGNLDSFIGKDDWALETSPDLRRNQALYNGDDKKYLDNAVRMLLKKFRGTPTNVSNDQPLLRYAEVLMIFAEATTMANGAPTAAAYDALNAVRRRAFGQDPAVPYPAADFPAGLSAVAFREALILERAKEFMCEGKRWFDLLRTNTALQVMLAIPSKNKITAKNLLWPIPKEEIDNNDELDADDQNPGW
jgi:hypothetical protein